MRSVSHGMSTFGDLGMPGLGLSFLGEVFWGIWGNFPYSHCTFECFPKIGGNPPKSWILIGVSIIFTIHFVVFSPYFWKHPFKTLLNSKSQKVRFGNILSIWPSSINSISAMGSIMGSSDPPNATFPPRNKALLRAY